MWSRYKDIKCCSVVHAILYIQKYEIFAYFFFKGDSMHRWILDACSVHVDSFMGMWIVVMIISLRVVALSSANPHV